MKLSVPLQMAYKCLINSKFLFAAKVDPSTYLENVSLFYLQGKKKDATYPTLHVTEKSSPTDPAR